MKRSLLFLWMIIVCHLIHAQQDSCSSFRQLTTNAREGANTARQIISTSPGNFLSVLLPCLARDAANWYYRIDTVENKAMCQLFSTDSLYALIKHTTNANELTFTVEKFRGPDPVRFEPTVWHAVLHTEAQMGSNTANNIKGKIKSKVSSDTTAPGSINKVFFCEQLTNLLREAGNNFRNISIAYRHQGSRVANYSSAITLQQNPLNNYIEIDNLKRRIRYTEIIDDKNFTATMIQECMGNIPDAKAWKRLKSDTRLTYKGRMMEIAFLPASPSKNRGAVLMITKLFK